MPSLGIDIAIILHDLALVALAFALTFPIGWERGSGRHSVGFRTLPIVAMAACGFALIVAVNSPDNAEAQARVLQGIITGIGFIGGGAIVKQAGSVHGLATAPSIWNAGAIGAAVALGRTNIAIVLSVINIASLWLFSRFRAQDEPGRPEDDQA